MTAYCGRLIHHLERNAPELTNKWVAIAVPTPSGIEMAVNHGYDGWSVGNTKHIKESKEFLEWLITEKLIGFYATLPLHYQPTRYSIYEDPEWQNLPLVKKYSDYVKLQRDWLNPSLTYINSIDTDGPYPDIRPAKVWGSFFLGRMLQNLVIRKMSPEKVVEAAADEIREMLKE